MKFEHTHRMIAQGAGLLTIILAVWTWRVEKRRWLRLFGPGRLGTVIAQGILGGITVLFYLPASRLVGARRAGADISSASPSPSQCSPAGGGSKRAPRRVRPAPSQPVHPHAAFDFRALRPVDSGGDVPSPRFKLVASRRPRGRGLVRPGLDRSSRAHRLSADRSRTPARDPDAVAW